MRCIDRAQERWSSPQYSSYVKGKRLLSCIAQLVDQFNCECVLTHFPKSPVRMAKKNKTAFPNICDNWASPQSNIIVLTMNRSIRRALISGHTQRRMVSVSTVRLQMFKFTFTKLSRAAQYTIGTFDRLICVCVERDDANAAGVIGLFTICTLISFAFIRRVLHVWPRSLHTSAVDTVLLIIRKYIKRFNLIVLQCE